MTSNSNGVLASQEFDPPLSDREQRLAEYAADIAGSRLKSSFYEEVGRTVVNRIFWLVGVAGVSFALGKGWINFSAITGH